MTTINNAPPKESHTVRNTLVAGGIGAALYGGSAAIAQKVVIANADTCTALVNKMENDEFVSQAVKKGKAKILEIAESGKLDYKHLGKTALIGSAVFAGIYLIGKGIKSLFSKN